jgi:spore coat protein B
MGESCEGGFYMDFSFLVNSIGKKVQVERGGPDKLEGKLVFIRPEFLILETEQNGYVYVQSKHIKTVSEPVIPEIQMQANTEEKNTNILPMVEAEDFVELLRKLRHRLIRVNHGGPNVIQGVLIEVGDESVTILHQMKDFVYYPIYHIRSVTCIFNNQNKKENENKQANEMKQDNSRDRGLYELSESDVSGKSRSETSSRRSEYSKSDYSGRGK